MLGFIFGFANFGGVVMMFISSRLQAIIHNWRMCYTIMGILVLVEDFLCISFFIRTPEQMGQKPLGWENSELAIEGDSNHNDSDLPDKYIAASLAGFGVTAANQLCPTISLDIFGRSAYNTVCSYLVGVSYVGSAASAVVMNIFINATGSMQAEYGICAIMVTLSLVLVFVSFLTAPIRRKK